FGSEPDVDPKFFALKSAIAAGTVEVLPERRTTRDQRLPAELRAFFNEDDCMPALPGNVGTFQTCRTTAHNHHLLGSGCAGQLGPILLAANNRVLHAAHAQADIDAVDTALI